MFPEAKNPKHREILFVRETNEHIAIWEGEKLSKEAAFAVSGIKTVYWLTEFNKVFHDLMTEVENIYFNTNEHYRQAVETQTREDRFIEWCKKKYPAHKWERSNPILQQIRGVKEVQELELLQTACDITERGFKRVLSFIKPGVMEYELRPNLCMNFCVTDRKDLLIHQL